MCQLCEIYQGTGGVKMPPNLGHKGQISLLHVWDKIWLPELMSA